MITVDVPDGLFEPRDVMVEPEPPATLRIDVFSLFPRSSTTSARRACSARRATAGCSTCAATTSATRPPTSTARSTTRRSAAAPGMVMRAQPIFESVEAADPPRPLLLLGPGGRRFDQALAHELAAGDGFSLLCGRYEGVDHRSRASRRRRDQRRRRRAQRGRGRRLPGRSRRSPGCATARWATPTARSPRASASPGCSRSPTTPGPPSSAAGRSPRCCAAATMPGSSAGGRPAAAPHARDRPDLIEARGGLTTMSAPVGRVPSRPVSLTGPIGATVRRADRRGTIATPRRRRRHEEPPTSSTTIRSATTSPSSRRVTS